MRKPERRCPPYQGEEPYLHFCFAEKDRETVFPLLEHLYRRGVRVWYSVKTTADINRLMDEQERMNKASLLVIYLTENARRDARVKNALLYYQHGKPVIGIDTDDGDNELVFGLTAAARHVNGRIGRNLEDMEAELIRTQGFTQELIGEPKTGRNWIRRATAWILAGILLIAGVFAYGYTKGWYGERIDPDPDQLERTPLITATPTPSPSPTPSPTPTPTPTPTAEPTPTVIPDTVTFEDLAFTEAVRRAVPGGVITGETLSEVETLELEQLPEDLTMLEQLPALNKLKLPADQAVNALEKLGERYTIVLAPEEVEAQ